MHRRNKQPPSIHLVSSTESSEFAQLTRALTRSSLIGLDAEWKPIRTHIGQPAYPTVALLQLACQLSPDFGVRAAESTDSEVFLLDLVSIPLNSVWKLLRDLFVSPAILKLGFRFKQDLKYLSSTFCSQGCDPGFDRVEPFLDIQSIYNHIQHKQNGRTSQKQIKSLSTICEELLGFSLDKELQCSDWSLRPLTEEQKIYATMDAQCLLDIFFVFQSDIVKKGNLTNNVTKLPPPNTSQGLREVLQEQDVIDKILRIKCREASHVVRATASHFPQCMAIVEGSFSRSIGISFMPMEPNLLLVIRRYGEKILLEELDRKPKASKRKGRKRPAIGLVSKEKRPESSGVCQCSAPWDVSLGGDGCPKFLCDVMVEGLAKYLRCVGIDAAIPNSKRPDSRELMDQAQKEKRVLLSRDAKLLRHGYLIKNQIYMVKSLLKKEQLLEVIEAFGLKISEDKLMSRCTKCNGRFIQKPLTTEEAIEAAKGFQRIPNCLFDKNIEFWQCMDCHQLYWEGTQYDNAVQKFIDLCKLNE